MVAADPELENEVVANERFVDPVHVVDLSAPVSVCNTFKCRFVCMYLKEAAVPSVDTGVHVRCVMCAYMCVLCVLCVCVCVCARVLLGLILYCRSHCL